MEPEMLKFYVRWRMNPKETFKTPEERGKFVMAMLGSVKAEMQAGAIKDFGICTDGSGGYAIYEVPNEADVFASLQKWASHVHFDARRVLTVEQLIQARKEPANASEKQTP